MYVIKVIQFVFLGVLLSVWNSPSFATYQSGYHNYGAKHYGYGHHNGKYKKNTKLSPNLVELWTIDTDLIKPESVVYDEQRDVLYVSNIAAGGGSDKDGIGYISIVSTDGEVLNTEWISGLDAPKGLALNGDTLYVSDIDRLIEIDVSAGAISNVYPATDAQFLNDVAVDHYGFVYVSDTRQNRIYRLAYGSFELWLDDERISRPNGLFAKRGRLIVAAGDPSADRPDRSRYLSSVNLWTKAIRPLRDQEPIGALDGVSKSNSGGYFLTDYRSGEIFHYTRKSGATVLETLERGTADLTYRKDANILYLPVLDTSKLIAYKVLWCR